LKVLVVVISLISLGVRGTGQRVRLARPAHPHLDADRSIHPDRVSRPVRDAAGSDGRDRARREEKKIAAGVRQATVAPAGDHFEVLGHTADGKEIRGPLERR